MHPIAAYMSSLLDNISMILWTTVNIIKMMLFVIFVPARQGTAQTNQSPCKLAITPGCFATLPHSLER